MAGGKHLYPRATFKRILKSNTKLRLSKNVDILVFLDYVLFMEEYVTFFSLTLSLLSLNPLPYPQPLFGIERR